MRRGGRGTAVPVLHGRGVVRALLLAVRAKPMTESYKTKEGKTITRQNGSVEWTAIKRTHDGRYQAVADEGQNGFDASKAATFLETVYEPAFTTEP